MKTLLFLCFLVCVVILSTLPGRTHAKKKVVLKVKDKKAEIKKYKKLYANIVTKYRQLSLNQEKVALENQKKWFEFEMKWLKPKGKDAKKLKKQKASEEKKLRLEEAKRWNKLNVEELKISTERNRIELELAKLQGKPTNWAMRDEYLEEVNDPKPKKSSVPKKKAAKAKDAKTKMASPKNAKASTGKKLNEWSNGWNNDNYRNMESYGSYDMGSEMYDEDETLNDPKPKKPSVPKKKAAKAKDAKTNMPSPKNAKASTGKKLNEWSNGWNNENYGNMESYGSYDMGSEMDDEDETLNDPKAKKPSVPKKKAAKAKDAKTKMPSPKNAKASTGKKLNEWSNGWNNENYGNMESYGSYDMGSEMYDEDETLNDPKPKKPSVPKKKAAKAKDAKTKMASPKNAKASTGKKLNEWSNGWNNENYGNMESYRSYYMGSEMYDEEETL